MNIRNIVFWIVCVLISVFIAGCATNIEEDVDIILGHDYFPLELDKYWIYKSDSTIYTRDGLTVTNRSSFIREELAEMFIADSGDTTYRLARYWSQDGNNPWILTDNWSVKRNELGLIRNEDNLSFIKLVFPPDIGKSWDGNAFIPEEIRVDIGGEEVDMLKNWEYKILERLDSIFIGNTLYSDVLSVQQVDDQLINEIERRYSVEKYARGVGMISREMMILDTQCFPCPDVAWEDKAYRGFILHEELIEHN